jgi:hypothetical protein
VEAAYQALVGSMMGRDDLFFKTILQDYFSGQEPPLGRREALLKSALVTLVLRKRSSDQLRTHHRKPELEGIRDWVRVWSLTLHGVGFSERR